MTPEQEWEKKVRRILMDPDGRKALKAFGIDVEMVGAPGAEVEGLSDKPVIAVLCPAYRAPDPKMGSALRKAMEFLNKSGQAIAYEGRTTGGSIIHWVRNWLVAEQLRSGKPWTHVLFIDDDIVIEEDVISRLLSHKKDIVAGLCTRRNDPPIPNIRFYDSESGDTKQIWEWPPNQLIEVDAVGTGLMLISQHALEQIAQVYFDCLWEQKFYGLAGERLAELQKTRLEYFDKEKNAYWFRCLPTPKGDIEMGEDVTFCHLAKKYCNLSVYVDTSVQPEHLGLYGYGVKDFLPYRDYCVERAKAEGKYKAQPRIEAEIQLVG